MKRRNKKKGVPMPRWRPADLAMLRRHYGHLSNELLGWLLGRSASSVGCRATRMGLRKDPARLVAMGRQNVAKRWHPCG